MVGSLSPGVPGPQAVRESLCFWSNVNYEIRQALRLEQCFHLAAARV
jgi:hypothetical protein